MPLYKVKYVEEVVMVGYVEADSEEEAIELFEDGQIDDTQDIDSMGLKLEEIEEVTDEDY